MMDVQRLQRPRGLGRARSSGPVAGLGRRREWRALAGYAGSPG